MGCLHSLIFGRNTLSVNAIIFRFFTLCALYLCLFVGTMQVNLGRMDESKVNKYERKVRAETVSEREDFRSYQQRRMLSHSERSGGTSISDKLDVQIENNHVADQKHKVSDGIPVTPYLSSRQNSIREFLTDRSTKAPTLRSHKSYFDTHFVDDNKEILDHNQVKFIATISRYTVLSFVAFATTILGSSSGYLLENIAIALFIFLCFVFVRFSISYSDCNVFLFSFA